MRLRHGASKNGLNHAALAPPGKKTNPGTFCRPRAQWLELRCHNGAEFIA
jgi:hypothetical protein